MGFLTNLVLYIGALPLLPIAAILLTILWVFRQLVRLLLYIRLGDQFGGLLPAADKLYTPKAISRKNLCFVIYVRSDEKIDLFWRFKERTRKKVFDRPEDYPKLLATHHTFLAQDYFLKNQVTIEDTIKPIPLPVDVDKGDIFNEEYLKKFVGEICNTKFHKNDTALWMMYVATEPLLDFGSKVKGYVYPIIGKFHHAVADGARMVALTSHLYADELDGDYYEQLKFENGKGKTHLAQILNIIQLIVYTLYLAFIGIVTILQFSFFKTYHNNALLGPALTEDKMVAWCAEYDSQKVAMVKAIKNRIPNTRFSEVLFTCVSASLYNYFKKHNSKTPKDISVMIPILFFVPPSDKSKPVDLKNEFTFVPMELPMVNPSKFMEGLEAIKVNMKKMRRSPDKDILYWIMNYLGAVIPGPILKVMLYTKPYTCTISSVPGTKSIKLLGGCEILSAMATAPHTNHTGVTFTIYTYDNKFHITLLVDKALISDQKDAQFLVDDVLRNIEGLNKESLKTCLPHK